MTPRASHHSCVAILGDLVESRHGDRSSTHDALLNALDALNANAASGHRQALEPLHPTVGDEIQGIYPALGPAIRATHLLRLALLTDGVDIRFGLGRGSVEVIDAERSIQDGSAWWSAREAVTAVHERARTAAYAGVRTEAASAESADPGPLSDAVLTAQLQLIDTRLSSLRRGMHGSLSGLLEGASNADTAAALGISPSANSQRVITHDLRPLADAMTALWRLGDGE
ncbi:MAG: SatD family protein [Dermabacter sp.]|nr:SatD family protein [Dermabacter sp.]